MATYSISQLPSFVGNGEVVWSLHDEECNIQLKRGRLSGEWLDWSEESQDWNGRPMAEKELLDMVKKAKIILPTKPAVTVANLIKQGKVKLAEWV